MRVEHPLGITRGAGGVAKNCRLALVEVRPLVRVRLGRDRLVVIYCFAEYPLSVTAFYNYVLDVGNLVSNFGQHGNQGLVNDDHLIVSVVDNEGQLFGKKANIEGVQNSSHGGYRQIDLHVRLRVPHNGTDTRIGLDTEGNQQISETPSISGDVTEGGNVHSRWRDGKHLFGTVHLLPTKNDVSNQEWCILHGALHRAPFRRQLRCYKTFHGQSATTTSYSPRQEGRVHLHNESAVSDRAQRCPADPPYDDCVKHTSVAVVGGGVVGLTTAWRLASMGYAVSVFDPSAGRGASFAAAGMLAPGAEMVSGEEGNFQLQRDSAARWKAISRDLVTRGGRNITVHDVGSLLVGWEASDRRFVAQQATLLAGVNVEAPEVSRSDQPRLFEGISDRVATGVLLTGDGWLDPDEAMTALREGLDIVGTEWITEMVERVTPSASGIDVHSTDGTRHYDAAIFATGAHPLVAGIHSTATVRPVRGSTIRGHGLNRFGLPMIRAFVRGRPFYLIGRSNEAVVFGASADEKSALVVELGELHRLLRDALDVLPALETVEWGEIRTGLRPTSPSGEPFFDAHSGEHWAWTSGHYRHGVTLAPRAAEEAVTFLEEMFS